jgi:hypothetical protein
MADRSRCGVSALYQIHTGHVTLFAVRGADAGGVAFVRRKNGDNFAAGKRADNVHRQSLFGIGGQRDAGYAGALHDGARKRRSRNNGRCFFRAKGWNRSQQQGGGDQDFRSREHKFSPSVGFTSLISIAKFSRATVWAPIVRAY